ncbi:MAG: ATP-binding protein [Kiritimatiellae bacterium]|nr:ATP-binding protein [Kiritimatiellia bacterium]
MKNEDQNIEYKQNWRDEYLRWICGFANADGGRMLIGVSDDKKGNEILGVPDWKSLLEIIPNLMKNTMGMIANVNHIREKGFRGWDVGGRGGARCAQGSCKSKRREDGK